MLPTRIIDLRAEVLDLALTEPFAIASGTQHVAGNLLIRLTLADGSIGLGEASPFPAVSGETQAGGLVAVEAARALLIGQDAHAWRPLCSSLADALPGEPAARCGIEMALFDAVARSHRMPLWSWFGGAGTALETDMTITAGDREHALSSARAIVARGIHVFKVKVGALSPEEDLERLRAIHEVAPGARLVADANGGYTAEGALRFLEGVARAGLPLELLEQPVPRDDWRGMAEVTAGTNAMASKAGGAKAGASLAGRSQVVICADESARSSADVLRLAREGAAHAVNIKLTKCGVQEALAMWSVARATGLRLMIGEMVESVLATSFLVHFAAGLGGFEWVDLDTPMFIAEHPFRGGYRQMGARLDVAHVVAGHGVEV